MSEFTALPKGWEQVELGEILDSIEKIDPSQKPNTMISYLDISSIDNTLNKVTNSKKLLGSDAPSRARQLVKGGDVLFSTVRPYLRTIAQVPEIIENPVASTGFCVLRGEKGIVQKYLYFLSISECFLKSILPLQRGVSYPAVRAKDIYSILVPLAPEQEQPRIVEKIEEIFSDLEQGVADLKEAQVKLGHYRQSLLKSSVEGALTAEWRSQNADKIRETGEQLLDRILKQRKENWQAQQLADFEAKGKIPPKNWEDKYKEPITPANTDLPELPRGWVTLNLDAFIVSNGTGTKTGPFGSLLKKYEHQKEGVPVVGIENIHRMKFSKESKIHITKEKAIELSDYDLQPGDIVISRSGTVGEVCVIPSDLGIARFSTNIIRVRVEKEIIRPEYFCLLFNADPFILNQVKELCAGSTRDFLNTKILKSIKFRLPSIIEQDKILSLVNLEIDKNDFLQADVVERLKETTAQRKNILKDAFSGKLVLQDPSDKPANELLKKIKAERAILALLPKPKPERKSTEIMNVIDETNLKIWIEKLDKITFSFDEIRKAFNSDYDLIKNTLFEVLAEKESVIEQVFDEELGVIVFKKVSK